MKLEALIIEPSSDGAATSRRTLTKWQDISEAVGGPFTLAPTLRALTIYVNDDGIEGGLPVNVLASQLWKAYGRHNDPKARLHGTAVILGPPDGDMDTSCPPALFSQFGL